MVIIVNVENNYDTILSNFLQQNFIACYNIVIDAILLPIIIYIIVYRADLTSFCSSFCLSIMVYNALNVRDRNGSVLPNPRAKTKAKVREAMA